MKQWKKILAIATVFVLCMAPLLSTPLDAYAASSTATTYYLKYVDSLSQFRYQKGTWQEDQEHWDVNSLKANIQDGDLLVIDGTNGQGIELSLSVSLNNLTVVNGDLVIVTASKFTDVYLLNGSKTVINGDVTNAYVYENSLGNFNNNVKNLTYSCGKFATPVGTIAVLGTCDYFGIENGMKTYSFAQNTLRMTDGYFSTPAANYTTTAPATVPSTSSDEYDDVPKTADTTLNPLWLLLISAVCFVGSIATRKIK